MTGTRRHFLPRSGPRWPPAPAFVLGYHSVLRRDNQEMLACLLLHSRKCWVHVILLLCPCQPCGCAVLGNGRDLMLAACC